MATTTKHHIFKKHYYMDIKKLNCKRNQHLPSVVKILTLLLLANMSIASSNSALLTNIFTPELSELFEGARRYLISPEQETNSARNTNSVTSQTLDGQSQSQSPPQTLANAWKNNNNNNNNQQQMQQLMSRNSANLLKSVDSTNPQQKMLQLSPSQLQDTIVASALNAGISSTTDFPNPNLGNLGSEITKILKKFFIHGYDKRVRPNYSGPPALVNVSFHIIGISSVDEVQMDFTTDFYFRQKWFDPRLVFDPVGEIDELCVGAEFAEKIWLPDTFFANEKTATFHKATTENTFIRIGSNGRVYRSIRLTVTCSCPMDLQYFPMDRQRCKIEIESYGYNTLDIDYRWESGDESVTLNTKIELPQFKILGFRMGQEIQNLSSGDYIRLYCEIHFVRSMGYYLIQIYIPASLIVMISWVSFWLHRNATPARVALGVTTVLTMTTLMSSTNAALPKISYIKSIDVFLGTCFVMVFAALLEYASVGYIGKRIAMKRKRLQNLHDIQQHHQKVCVAAAASAAAAAAHEASLNSPDIAGNDNFNGHENPKSFASWTAQSFRAATMLGSHRHQVQQHQQFDGTKTRGKMQQMQARTENQDHSNEKTKESNNDNLVKQRKLPNNTKQQPDSVIQQRPSLATNNFHLANNGQNDQRQQQKAPTFIPTLTLNHGPVPEFDVTQTHDMIRIIGLTPSSIDKHSRVVFPICFVCFNLMYWIIYGHISQQTEDRESRLIPFIRG